MAIKENIDAIKQEISAEEQFLESVIKVESIWKKYKMLIIASLVIIVLAILGSLIYTYLQNQKLEKSNLAYEKLLKDPNDKNALDTLKANNQPLYEAYIFQRAIISKNVQDIDELSSKIKDPILIDLAKYQSLSLQEKDMNGYLNNQKAIIKDLSYLQEGYLLLKSGKIDEAKNVFSQISANSPAKGIADSLSHYGIAK